MGTTVPGTSGAATLALGTGDILNLSLQLGALLASVQGAGNLIVTGGDFSTPFPTPPTVSGGTTTELFIGDTMSGSATVPGGYAYVIDANAPPSTIYGSNMGLMTGTTGGAFYATGTSTVAVNGGDNLIATNGNYLISTAPGNDTIGAVGQGTIATDSGANLIFVTGVNLVASIGQDTVVGVSGLSTVLSSGSQSLIFGGSDPNSTLIITVDGAMTTVAASGSAAQITASGGQDLVFGAAAGGGALSLLDNASNDTIAGGSPATVAAGSGSSGLLVFSGAGGLTFYGNSNTATVVSSTGTNSIFGSTGGLLVGAGGDDTVSGSAPGGATIFGSANHSVTYLGKGDLLYGAGAGYETLNAAATNGNNTFFGNQTAGSADSIVGGLGSSTFVSGAGSDTLVGGSGGNTFFFLQRLTQGNHDFVVNLGSTDNVDLIGYGGSANSSISIANSSATLTLSDNTQITFVNVFDIKNNIHIS